MTYSGYMAPEYALHGYLSVKTDVFSFGILVLEIVSGRKNHDGHLGAEKADLLNYVRIAQVLKSILQGLANSLHSGFLIKECVGS